MQLCKPTFLSVSLFLCFSVSYAEMSPKNAFYYKHKTLTSENITLENIFTFKNFQMSQMNMVAAFWRFLRPCYYKNI